jgi:hypothetical protein
MIPAAGKGAIMAKWYFSVLDNGGKRQSFTVSAPSKPEAIEKGMKRAKKNAAGDIHTWDCKLKSV